MRILIAFGSKRGGTLGLAQTIGEVLTQAGHQVDVRPAYELDGLQGWDAAIVGGALYAGFWLRSTRRFVERHVDELERMPVWFFSSGPLDDSASKAEIPPTAQVRRLMERIHARGHATFGGRLEPESKGFIAHAMVKQGRAGDWLDLEAVKFWSRGIALELAKLKLPEQAMPAKHPQLGRLGRGLVTALCLFTGVTAVWGGLVMMAWPTGSPWTPGLNLSMLQHSPFFDFLGPGLLLFGVVGLLNLVAAALALRRHRFGEIVAFGAGSSISIWIAVEFALLRAFSWLQVLYLAVGICTMTLAQGLWLRRRAAVHSHVWAKAAPRVARKDGAARGVQAQGAPGAL